MAQYTKKTATLQNGGTSTRYKLDGTYVKPSEVPEEVVTALTNLNDGDLVDEKGKAIVADKNETSTPAPEQAPTEPKAAEEPAPAKEPEAPKAPEKTEDEDESEVDKNAKDPAEDKKTEDTTDDGIDSADDIDDDSGLDVEEQARAERLRAGLEADEEGMGFKTNKDGKTVDIFDGKTPHTHIRYVSGVVVPLSEKNFNEKTDGEIQTKLKKLGKL